MTRHKSGKDYPLPALREAKELADRCGKAYHETLWRGPRLMSQRYVIESAAQVLDHDFSKDLERLDEGIRQAAVDLLAARENLQKARAQLAALKGVTVGAGLEPGATPAGRHPR